MVGTAPGPPGQVVSSGHTVKRDAPIDQLPTFGAQMKMMSRPCWQLFMSLMNYLGLSCWVSGPVSRTRFRCREPHNWRAAVLQELACGSA